MLRPALCIIVMAASLSVGMYLSSRLSQRVATLSDFIVLSEEVAARMAYTSAPLAILFQDNFAGFSFAENRPFSDQFMQMIYAYKDILTPEDIRLLEEYGSELGTGDVDSQLKRIRLYIALLTEQCENAREEVRQKGKLYRILPLSAGIAIAILLI